MRVEVRLFAVARQRVGKPSMTVDLSDFATVAELRRALESTFPELADLLPHLRIAIDSEYVEDDHRIAPNSEVAIIPPVSGGGDG